MAYNSYDPMSWMNFGQGQAQNMAGYAAPYSDSGMSAGGHGGGLFGGMNPLALGTSAVGALGGLYSGIHNAGAQKKLMDEQLRMARLQRGEFQQNLPQYNAALQQYGQNIGLVPGGPQGYGNAGQQYRGGSIGQHAGVGAGQTATYQNPFSPGADNGYLMGPYAQQAYRLRSAANEQNLQHNMQGADQNLLFQAQQRGLASGSAAAALAREHQGLLQDYANSQRNLAINAGPAEQAQIASYMGLLQPGLNMAQPAEAILGQQAGTYGNMANQGFSAAGQSLSNLAQMSAMAQYANQYGMNPYAMMGGYGPSGYGSNYGTSPFSMGNPNAMGYGT